MKRAILKFFMIFLSFPSFASSGVTVQGRLLHSDSSPVTSPQLQFKIQIRSPGNENCLLYEETQIKDLSSSDGNFSFIVQDALETSRVRIDTTGLSLEKIFANRVAFTGLSCGIGTSYTPSATDGRVLQVLFREDVSAAWEPMPSQRVSAVPVALQALQIEGYTSSQLLRVADGSTLTELTAGDATNLSTLIAGTSASFVKPADLPACNANEYLTKSGSTVSCAPVSGSSGGTVTSVATGTGLTGGPIVSSGTIALANIASHTLLGNATGGAAAPSATSLTSMIDASMGGAQGSVLYRDASGWTVLAPGTSGYFLKTQGASANPVWASAGSGSVSSVDLTAPSIFSVAGNPITSSGTIALSLVNQSANTVFAGPASGGAAAPSFRALNIPDLRSSVAGAFLTGSGCTAGQGLVYNSVNDNISCQDIAVTSSQVTTGLGYTPVNKAGDTMSGALNLPSNGLTVGTNQLVVSGAKIGVGTSSPSYVLDVYANVSAYTPAVNVINAGSFGYGVNVTTSNASGNGITIKAVSNSTDMPTVISASAAGAGNTGYAIYSQNASASGYNIYAVGSSFNYFGGNVGIGTTGPTAALDVVGAINLSGMNGIRFMTDPAINPDPIAPGGSIAIGNGAFPSTSSYHGIAIGYQALKNASMTGGDNIAIGFGTLQNATTGSGNTAVGSWVLKNLTTGQHNTGIGFVASNRNTTGDDNSGFGYAANNSVTTGSKNTSLGSLAGQADTGNRNTAVGYAALIGGPTYVSGDSNTAIGDSALYNLYGVVSNNTAVGASALYGVTSGATNVALGFNSGRSITTGSNNVILGPSVAGTTLTTGSGNILIGTSSAVDAPSGGTSNFLNIGNLIYATGMTGTLAVPAGSVGIGTADPSVLLTVSGSDTWASEIRVENRSSTSSINPSLSAYNWAGSFSGYPTIGLYNARGSKASPVVLGSGDGLGSVEFYGYDGASNGFGGSISMMAAETYSGTGHGADMTFATVGVGTINASERMRITSNGNVGIGTSDPQYNLHVAGTTRLMGNVYVDNFPANSGNFSVCLLAGGQLTASGTGCSSSDERVKTEIKDMPSSDGLEAILQLRPVVFNWKDVEQARLEGPQVGFIAQEVRPHFPQLVAESKGDFVIRLPNGEQEIVKDKLSVDYQKLTAPIVKSIQEFYRLWSEDVSSTKAELANLKAEQESMRAENQAMKKALCELGQRPFCP